MSINREIREILEKNLYLTAFVSKSRHSVLKWVACLADISLCRFHFVYLAYFAVTPFKTPQAA